MAADVLEYLLPDGTGASQARALLVAGIDLDGGAVRSADRTFYDTFDGRLHAAELRLVLDGGRLTLTRAGAELATAEQPRRPRRMLAADLPGARLRELLAPVLGVRALTPIARTRSHLLALRALDDEAKTVVRLEVEHASVALAGRRSAPLPPRVRLAPVRGYDKALGRVRRALEDELGLQPARAPLLDEAVRASGGAVGGTSSKLRVDVHPEQRADAAAVILLTALLATMEENLPGALADVDIEFLHDLRVAVRRSRSAQRQLKGVFAPEPLARFRAEFRRLQQVTGPTRDLDVQLLELGPEPELAPLRELLTARRTRERRRMTRALRAARTTTLLAEWDAFLHETVAAPATARPDALRPIGAVAGARIATVYRRMVKAGRAIGPDSPAEALHDLRKSGKELRYLLEFFAGLYPADVVKPMVKTLKALQDSLGRFQDREVQAAVLHALAGEVAALPDGPAALMVMGRLTARLAHEQEEARDEFAERFAAFAARSQRALVRETFR